MPDREHTDPRALDQFYKLTSAETPRRPWYRRLWTWLDEEFWKMPYEPRPEDTGVARRLRIHKLGLRGAQRLHKLDRGEAQEILTVAAMLLGFELSRPIRRAREARRP